MGHCPPSPKCWLYALSCTQICKASASVKGGRVGISRREARLTTQYPLGRAAPAALKSMKLRPTYTPDG